MDESEEDIRLGWDWGDYTLFQVKVYRSVSRTEYSLYPVHGPGCPESRVWTADMVQQLNFNSVRSRHQRRFRCVAE